MPIYTFRNEKTGETKDLVMRMTEKHEYIDETGYKWSRVFYSPNASIDTNINPHSSKEFYEKMGRKKCKIGEMMDESKIASEKRAKSIGFDPVKEKYLKNYSKRRRGKVHPEVAKQRAEGTFEIQL